MEEMEPDYRSGETTAVSEMCGDMVEVVTGGSDGVLRKTQSMQE